MSLERRVIKLEAAIAPSSRRMWIICQQEDESSVDAITRHGIGPGASDPVVLLRYGRCQMCADAE